ncbi:hypothetical protein H6F44_04750 [Pseudanabaena sp. FACHB-1277]|jgi:hypothetical protein|uniref:Uncharacterized protein n=1 Tax=Pseudanabaena cinerea FACHB-1277 TaxID=2949581 RepID=A0A926Z5B6_9CYAN|nr:hypothetical protein [Pseudanabaena cinerea]MBD2149437.1 hypothetical protein [Pseudanabaena cinerea FACHB-1277]
MKCPAILIILLLLVSCSSQNTSQSSPTDTSISPITAESPTKQVDYFAGGVNKATNAAKLAQTAKSASEWRQVEAEWQSAINFMEYESTSSSNYKAAKQRVMEYKKRLTNAQQNASRLEQAQVKLQNTQIIRGGEVFRSLNGIHQTAGEATAIPVVRIVIPQSGWKKLSKSDQISLAIYAESLVSVVKSNPSNYVSIPSSAPIYNSFVSKIANLCQDCWSIVVSRQDSQPYGIDETIVQGDTPWRSDDPCCRGIKSSEFKK